MQSEKLSFFIFLFAYFSGQWDPPILGLCQQGINGGLAVAGNTGASCNLEIPSVLNGAIRYSLVGFVIKIDMFQSFKLKNE